MKTKDWVQLSCFLTVGSLLILATIIYAETNAQKVSRYTQHVGQNYVNYIGVGVQWADNPKTPELVYYDLPPLTSSPLVITATLDGKPVIITVAWSVSDKPLKQLDVFKR